MGEVAAERPHADTAWLPAAGLPSLLRAALPLVVSRAGLAAMIVADGWMVARHDAGQLALASLANGTFGRVTEVFAVAVMSALPLVAASGTPETRRALWRRAVATALLLGLAGIGIAALATPILGVMVDDRSLARGAADVVWILGLGLPAGLAALASAMYLEGRGRPVLVAGWVLAANGLNIVLNGLLIGGQAGFPAWGAYGSGLATTLVRIALAMVLAVLVWRMEGRALFASSTRDGIGARAQRRLAMGAGTATAGFHASAIWLTAFAGWMGAQSLAAFASCWVLAMPVMLLAVGIGDAIGMRAGERSCQPEKLRHDLACLSLVLSPFSLLLVGMPEGIAALYTADLTLRATIAGLLPIGGLVLLIDGLGYGLSAALRAQGDVVGSTAIQLGAMAATPVLAGSLAFGCGWGLYGLMLGILATSTVRLVLLTARAPMSRPLSLEP